MERIIEKLESRKGIFNLHGIPIHDIIGELTEVVVESGYPEEEKVKLAKFVKKGKRQMVGVQIGASHPTT